MAPDILNTLYANPIQFANQMGLYALLSIIPLIIIYLLRPRPKKIKIPSLMFLFDIEKKKRLNIFRKFLKDPLFLIQLLVLTIISLAVAAPFIMASQQAGGGHTVIILDASASMQADGRFGKAVTMANDHISDWNTIILAESVPMMVMKEAPSSSAVDALRKLKAKATTSDISSAIMLGSRTLPEGGKIVVLSDFISWSGDEPEVAKSVAEASGINVEFVTITGRTDNAGIVNGWFEDNGAYRVIIRNFNKDAKDVRVDVTTNDKNVLSETRNIKGQTSDYISISDLASGITKISIDSNDALAVDNNAYVFIPSPENQNILYITDNIKSPSVVALGLIPLVNIKKTDSQNIPSFSGYGTVFVGSFLPSDAATSLSEYVKAGGNAVIIASTGLYEMDMLPVEPGSLSNSTSLNVIAVSGITDGIGIEQTDVKKHFNAKLKPGAISLVEGGDKSEMLAFWKYGKGLVIYSGLSDPKGTNIYDPLNEDVWNDFHANPAYPLFWRQMLEWISGSLDVTEYNAKTGMFIKLPATETVKTPGDSVTTDMLLLDEVGIYNLPDKDVAVNLFDERESNLEGGGISEVNATGSKEVPSSVSIVRKPLDLVIYFIIAAMFLVVFELYYLHWRGEL